ncbi:MAG: hypothetical protein KC432_00575, partial [Thermomicrobiales bacterium]|nr:hypothetical protein [Thermomicrobiales bacterium]
MATQVPGSRVPCAQRACASARSAGGRRQVIGAGLGWTFQAREGQRAHARQGTPQSGWTCTDIHGQPITLPRRPERVAAMITPGA